MSRFRKLSHAIWHCQYHVVWYPKYRFRILDGMVKKEVHNRIQVFCGRTECEVVELNIQADHVHLICMVPPKVSISEFMGENQGTNSNSSIQAVPLYEEETLLGQSFLGERLLRRYSRS